MRLLLEENPRRAQIFLIWGVPDRARHHLLKSPSKTVARFISLAFCLAMLMAISAATLPYVIEAHADEETLVTAASKRFQNLTVAEKRLLEYADTDSQHRGEFSVGGTSAEPKDPSNDPEQSASWPIQRNIRAELIRWLLVDRTVITRVDPKGIRVLGARIVGNLDLSNVHAERAIALVRCRLDQMNLDLAEIESLDLSGSYATSVHADHVVSHASMFLGWDGTDRGGDFHCSGKVYMPGARVGGELCFGGGRFQHLDADPEYWEASKKVAIDATNSKVEDDLTVCCDFEAHGAVDLDNATIGKALNGIGGRFINPDNVAISALGLSAANVSFFPGPDYPSQDPQVDGVLDFTTAQIQNNFVVLHAIFKGKPFEHHGFIGSGLSVGKGFVWKEATLENGAFLDLRDARLGGLCDDEKSWPVPGRLLIDGLMYDGICGPTSVSATKETASPTDAASRLKWLRLQPWFFPQPYRQLANWMRESGDDAGALKVLAAKAEAQSESSGEGMKSVPRLVSLEKATLALLSLAIFTATLIAIAYFSRRNRENVGQPSQTLPPVSATVEIYQRHRNGPRGIESIQNEKRPERGSSIEAKRSLGAAGNVDGQALFRREGEFWTIAYRGTTFRLRDVKGLAYIAYLLAHPGERFHVRELITEVEGRAVPASVIGPEVAREALKTQDLGDAGNALDQHAQSDYRRRLRELDEELAEAERFNDPGRAERIRQEVEFLHGELSAALGSGGRSRKAASHAERARGMVTKNIRAGLEKIRSEDAALGRYFAASIRTGYYCVYLPDPDRKIFWEL